MAPRNQAMKEFASNKRAAGHVLETHSPYKVLFALAHYNNDEFRIAASHSS